MRAVPPQVVSLPRDAVRAVPGQTVTFTCAATGVPTPIVTWRLNWGHPPSSHRWAGLVLVGGALVGAWFVLMGGA